MPSRCEVYRLYTVFVHSTDESSDEPGGHGHIALRSVNEIRILHSCTNSVQLVYRLSFLP